MLVLLPPSETKRSGGPDGSRLDLAALRYPALGAARRATLDAVAALARDPHAAVKALKLGPTQHHEVAKNLELESSAVMPAVDRYTGVLYDALRAGELPLDARRRLGERVVIHSAVLGPVGALDAVPDYRLSANSTLPGLQLKATWATSAAAVLAAEDGLIVDARSQGYVALGPAPSRPDVVYLNVLSEDADGRRRALNHFNKHAKGEFVRAVALSAEHPQTVAELVEWGRANGLRLEPGAGADGAGSISLVV